MTVPFIREATTRTPRVELNHEAGQLIIEGESYPEDITVFYDPLIAALKQHFTDKNAGLKCVINLSYFNSSSARQLMDILDIMDKHAKEGHPVEVVWCCDEDDDITHEFAEDISKEIEAIRFEIRLITDENRG
jgi:hypothetical protein